MTQPTPPGHEGLPAPDVTIDDGLTVGLTPGPGLCDPDRGATDDFVDGDWPIDLTVDVTVDSTVTGAVAGRISVAAVAGGRTGGEPDSTQPWHGPPGV